MTCGPSGIEGFDSLSPTIDKQSDAMRERYVEPQKGGTYTKHEHQALVLLRENKLMSKFQYPSKTKASFLKITPQEQTIPETFSKILQPTQSPNIFLLKKTGKKTCKRRI